MNLLYTVAVLSGISHGMAQDGVFLSPKNYEAQQVWVADVSKQQRLVERNDGVRIISSCSNLFTSKNAYGYRKGTRTFRFLGKQSLEVIYSEGIYIYRLEVDSQTSSELYYFSKTATDQPQILSKKHLKDAYQVDNPIFAESIAHLDWELSLTEPVHPTGNLRVIELFHYCTK